MSDAQLEDYRNTFNLFDSDKDEKLSLEEVLKGIKAIGLNPSLKELKDIAMKHEYTQDTTHICFDGFAMIISEFTKQVQREDLKKAFQTIDSNSTGRINWNEFATLLSECGANTEEMNFVKEKARLDDQGTFDYSSVIEEFNKLT